MSMSMRWIAAALLLLAAAPPSFAKAPAGGQDAEPGLIAEYFDLDAKPETWPALPAGRKPAFVRVEPDIQHALVTGNFHGTKLVENFFARWTGLLRCPETGLYNFYVESDDGCRLYIDNDLVVDNADGRAMDQKADRLTLTAGDHAIRFEYFQGEGVAGVNLQWKIPSGGRQILPAKHLFHAKDAEKIDWDRDAWGKRTAPPTQPAAAPKPGRYASIDFGPFLSRIVGPASSPVALSGVLLRVAPEATVCFDTRQLQVAAAWTGGFLNFPTEKDGVAGLPRVGGTITFSNPKEALGRGRWMGIHLHGNKAILSYTLDGADVLELHGYENGAFTRTLQVRKVEKPLTFTLAPTVPPLTIEKDGLYKVSVPKTDLSPPEDLSALLKGGPARWTTAVETKGTLGKEPGAYQVDTLTLPYENPWNSYMRLVALDFFPDGRAVVATLDGDVWIVSGIDDTLEKLSWKRYATGLQQPMGLRIIGGLVYVLGRDQITRLRDLNGDGEADSYENFNNAVQVGASSSEYAMDLQVGAGGDLYFGKAGTQGSGATEHSGCILRVSRDGSALEVYATGFRTPFGVCVGPDGYITATDQQGNYMASCPIVHVERGGFYGFAMDKHPETKTMPRQQALCWLPMDFDNSSGGQVWVTGDRWGPLKGSLLHTSYGQSRLLLVLLDEKRVQGGVVRFPLSFASGIMRAQFNPKDGQLYVAGLRGWQTTGVKDGCLQRVRSTGKPLNLPVTWKVRKTGIDLTFSDALDREIAADPDSYSAVWFQIESTPEYGSPEFSPLDRTKRGRQPIAISAATLGEDGKTVSLEIPGLRPVTNLIVKYSLRSAAGAKVQGDVALTVNRLPD
jgi:glucose/arabinose dehydrogenase